ncbi:(2Fe-2S)-binding protein, partial [Micromonospora fluostatini]
MSAKIDSPAPREPFDVNDPRLSRFDIVEEGARRDDIEIVHYEPQVVHGSKAERRLTRLVAGLFLLTGAASTAFLIIYIWWPWEYAPGRGGDKFYTPLLGLTLGVSLLAVGFGILIWGKKLLPKEVSIQDRHEGQYDAESGRIAGETMLYMADELGVRRRPLLGISLLAGLVPVTAVAAAPLVGGLLSDPHKN